jgi:hypothetical protein
VYSLAKGAVARSGWFGIAIVAGSGFALLWTILLCRQAVDIKSSGVMAWWTILSGIGFVNVWAWQRSAAAVARRKGSVTPSLYRFQRWQLLLSAVFVLGCGFRSLFPRADVQRIGLIDSWMSSVLVGRSVATIAELCFMAQWALLLYQVAKDAGSRVGVIISKCVVPMIVVAEICSWYAVLTTCYLGNTCEESIWALTALLLLVGCITVWSRCQPARRSFLAAGVVLAALYIAFMCSVDIPMYLTRWQADEACGRAYLNFSQGLMDCWSRRVVTFSWEEWRTEIPWMTLYFSVCVWCSLALPHINSFVPAPANTE